MKRAKLERELSTLLHAITAPAIKASYVYIYGSGGISIPRGTEGQFHYVIAGAAMIDCRNSSTTLDMRAGDFVLFTHPQAHVLYVPPNNEITTTDFFKSGTPSDTKGQYVGAPTEIRVGEGAIESAIVLVGTFPRDHLARNPLFASLPHVVHRSDHLTSDVPLYFSEYFPKREKSKLRGPGSLEVTRRFIDLKLAQIVHDNVLHHDLATSLSTEAVNIAQVIAAQRLLEREPERQWTVEGLAREVGMSRSAFAAAFKRSVGKPPMSYLNDMRMERALEMFNKTSHSVLAVSHAVGFMCEASFARAFKRFSGASPRKYRAGPIAQSVDAIAPWDPFLQ